MQFKKTILLALLSMSFHSVIMSMDDSRASAYYNAVIGIHPVKVDAYWSLHNKRISHYMKKINDPNTKDQIVSLFAKWLVNERKNNLVIWGFKEQQAKQDQSESDEWNEDVKLLAALIKSCESDKSIGDIIIKRAYTLQPNYSSKALADEISKDIAALSDK